jgi:hypothetical protein
MKFPVKFETGDLVGTVDEREALTGEYGQNTLCSPCQRCNCPYSTHLLWFREKAPKLNGGIEIRLCPKCVKPYLVPDRIKSIPGTNGNPA